jgi:hypothetical protein
MWSKAMRSSVNTVSLAVLAVSLTLVSEGTAAAPSVGIPLTCSHGPSDQKHNVMVSVPASAAQGATYKVRVDGVNSGKVSHTGLNYIYNMWSEWLVPAGTEYVAGSARVIPKTGSENVRAGARVVQKAGAINLVLPAHVENGSSYTPPSFEFSLKVTAKPGTTIAQSFRRYRVTANAFLIGTVDTTCDPKPKPFRVATTKVDAAPAAPSAP